MMIRRLILSIVLLLVAPLAYSESTSKTMTVTANVVASIRLTVQSEPAVVEVTSADIERGYVDVADPIVVRVQTNSRRGYLLQVGNADEAFSAVELRFGDTSMNVAYESFLQRPYVSGGESLAIRARLRLASNTQPGLHRLPIAFSASAL